MHNQTRMQLTLAQPHQIGHYVLKPLPLECWMFAADCCHPSCSYLNPETLLANVIHGVARMLQERLMSYWVQLALGRAAVLILYFTFCTRLDGKAVMVALAFLLHSDCQLA